MYYTAGSDDFNAYVWAVPALAVLKARRQDPFTCPEIKPENPPIGKNAAYHTLSLTG